MLPPIDDWVVLRDGSVAFIRGREYRVDWLSPSGQTVSSPRIPHDWRRLDGAEKRRIADSLTRDRASAVARLPEGVRPTFDVFGMLTGSTAVRPDDAMRGAGAVPPPILAEAIPDFLPVFTAGSALADAQDRIWIMLREGSMATGNVYDVIDRRGTLVDRVRLAPNHQIVGFGAGDAVYVTYMDGGSAVLEKRRFK
jgi:hypothetical protein